MASKKSATIQPNPILESAASLWKYLAANAGLDSLFYDKDILHGNDAEKGLYAHLGIKPRTSSFVEDLEYYKVPVERLVVAFFKTLQPFAQMMNDICVFFERNKVKETNKSFSIRFNFNDVKADSLEFNLEHFRQTLSQLSRVRQLVEYYHINSNEVWELTNLFGDNYSVTAKNTSARKWIDSYRVDYNNQQRAFFNPPDVEVPATGNAQLNEQLARVMAIWRSFVNSCRNVDANRVDFKEKLSGLRYDKENSSFNELTAPWPAMELRNIESDFWPGTLLEKLFYKLEQIETLPAMEKREQEALLATAIQNFFQKLPVSTGEEEQLLKELIDLLKLPVWERRSELYAAWILTLIDESVSGYKHIFHHQDGVLSLSFKATRLATIEINDGNINLWSEVRSSVEGTDERPLEGKSRKNSIQPDYSLYRNNSTTPVDCIAAIEVKQYKEHSTSNFRAALNDYTRGLPNASVILVNYGSVSETMELTTTERSHFFGQIKPGSPEIDLFKNELGKLFPHSP
ncbi:MAG: hypothetical protein JNK27_14810, partial [Chitinophagaceae bacterium]|nr:hypothetical protein [Chitinophagaceae bacterium]